MPLRAGRPRATELRADWKLSISARLAALVEMQLQNPITKKAGYGKRSELIEQLLKEWLARQGIEVGDVHVQDAGAAHGS